MKSKTQTMSVDEFKALKSQKKNKHRNTPTTYNGYTYQSKKEARWAEGLDGWIRTGVILSWIRQVPFHLPGKSKHYVDFLVFREDGTYELIEVKGRDLPEGKRKRAQVEELFKVSITVV